VTEKAVKETARAKSRARERADATSSSSKDPCELTNGQVFWLPDHPTGRTFPRF
jgi:hypothetical protein